jgi:hypothetical protein
MRAQENPSDRYPGQAASGWFLATAAVWSRLLRNYRRTFATISGVRTPLAKGDLSVRVQCGAAELANDADLQLTPPKHATISLQRPTRAGHRPRRSYAGSGAPDVDSPT